MLTASFQVPIHVILRMQRQEPTEAGRLVAPGNDMNHRSSTKKVLLERSYHQWNMPSVGSTIINHQPMAAEQFLAWYSSSPPRKPLMPFFPAAATVDEGNHWNSKLTQFAIYESLVSCFQPLSLPSYKITAVTKSVLRIIHRPHCLSSPRFPLRSWDWVLLPCLEFHRKHHEESVTSVSLVVCLTSGEKCRPLFKKMDTETLLR